jgi:hypothetical protein
MINGKWQMGEPSDGTNFRFSIIILFGKVAVAETQG